MGGGGDIVSVEKFFCLQHLRQSKRPFYCFYLFKNLHKFKIQSQKSFSSDRLSLFETHMYAKWQILMINEYGKWKVLKFSGVYRMI